MEDYSFIQGQTLLEITFALLSLVIASYVYFSWKLRAHRPVAAKPCSAPTPPIPSTRIESMRVYGFPRLRLDSASPHSWWKKHKAFIEDWLAPIIVWAVVLWSTLAVVAVLLGEG